MRAHNAWWLIVGLVAVAACSRQETTACVPEERYATARSAAPVQIPDDLSPPDEDDALRLPADVSATTVSTAGECLEAPPSFFGESRPFRRGEEAADREQAPPPQPAEGPSPGDRVIEN